MSMLEDRLKEATKLSKLAEFHAKRRRTEAERLGREILTYLKTDVDSEPQFFGRAMDMVIVLQTQCETADLWQTGFTLSAKCDDRPASNVTPLTPVPERTI